MQTPKFDDEFLKKLEELEAKKPENKRHAEVVKLFGELLTVANDLKNNTGDKSSFDAIINKLDKLATKADPIFPDGQNVVEAVQVLVKETKAEMAGLRSDVKAIKLDPKIAVQSPAVNVAAPEVTVQEPNLKPLFDKLDKSVEAMLTRLVKSIPEPKPTDLSEVHNKLDKANDYLEDIATSNRMKPLSSGGGSTETAALNTISTQQTDGSQKTQVTSFPSNDGTYATETGNLAALATGQTDGNQITRLQANGEVVDSTHPLPISGTFADASGVPYSSSNRLPVDANITASTVNASFPPAVVSSVNSSSTPLAANAVFTGQWEDVSQYASISAIINTDQVSATNGAVVQFSPDGVNVLRSVSSTIPANTGLTFILSPEARYVRFIYTNGSTAQTTMWAQVIYHYQTPTNPQIPLAASTTDLNLSEVSMAHLKGRHSSGAWQPVEWTTNGLKVDTGLAFPATQKVSDDYQAGEILADQNGAGSVLTFSFASPVDLIWINDIGATTTNISRADPFGGTPTSSAGIPIPNGVPTPITVVTSTVKVFAAVGSTISCYGYRRT